MKYNEIIIIRLKFISLGAMDFESVNSKWMVVYSIFSWKMIGIIHY